jgi:hypothetical protein
MSRGLEIGVLAPSAAMASLDELVAAYGAAGHSVLRMPMDRSPPSAAELRARARDVDALLVVGDRRRSPRTAVPGPVLDAGGGRRVPVGWLPDVGAPVLARFARAAARVHRRDGGRSVAVLGQWQPQYLRLADRIERLLGEGEHGIRTFKWTSDLVVRDDLLRGLGSGLSAAIYVGHGRPIGWVGYRGLRAHHMEGIGGEPLGLVLSVCCVTASRRRTGLSFAESIPLSGVAGAALAAVADTLHTWNTRLVVRLVGAIRARAPNIGALVLAALEPSPEILSEYRILGDPVAPLSAASGAEAFAAAVATHP